MSKSKSTAIIGAGAAGLVAAIACIKAGGECALFDGNDTMGKKILATGNGRCNFTNRDMSASKFLGCNQDFVGEVLKAFPASMTIKFFNDLDVIERERDGYFYPITNQATTIKNALVSEVMRLGVDIYTSTKVKNIEKNAEGFLVKTTDGNYVFDSVILATGGLCNSAFGCDGSGYNMAMRLGHRINPQTPGLSALKHNNKALASLSGVRTAATVKLYFEGGLIAYDSGELQLNKDNISGICVMNISRFAGKLLRENKTPLVYIDLLPFFTEEELQREFAARFSEKNWGKNVSEILNGLLNDKVIKYALNQLSIDWECDRESIDQKKLSKLRHFLKAVPVEITGIKDYDSAQVTCGGVDLSQINNKTMESTLCKGLYFAGEIMDVDGPCGGYNLQWAFATGYIAGIKSAQ